MKNSDRKLLSITIYVFTILMLLFEFKELFYLGIIPILVLYIIYECMILKVNSENEKGSSYTLMCMGLLMFISIIF